MNASHTHFVYLLFTFPLRVFLCFSSIYKWGNSVNYARKEGSLLLGYVKLNMKSMLKNHLGIFLLIMLSEIAAAICILFSYGLIMKMQDESKKLDYEMYYYDYDLSGKTELSGKFREFMDVMEGELDDLSASVEVTDKNGEKKEAWVGISFIHPKNNLASWSCDVNELEADLVENGKVIICGKEFSVRDIRPNAGLENIGNQPENALGEGYLIPFDSIPDDAVGRYFQFFVNSPPTKEKVDQINQHIENIFGVKPFYTPEPIDLMKKQENSTFYVYAILIVIIAVINLSMYFRYLTEKRRNQIQIFTVCGASVGSISFIFLVENLIELVIGYSVALAVFRLVMLRLIDSFYKYFSLYYSARIYIITFFIFAVGSLMILMLLISPHIRRAAYAGKES